MTFLPTGPFDTGGAVNATVSTAVADFGKDGSNTNRSQMAVQTHLAIHNILNIGATVPVAKN